MTLMPSAKSKQWFPWMAAYGLLLWLALGLHRFAFVGKPFDAIILLRFGLFAFAVSAVLNGFGWLGGRLVWFLSTIGIVLGVILMYFYTYRDMSGWEDLAGFLTFFLCMLGGFAVGLLAEGIYLLIKRLRRTPQI